MEDLADTWREVYETGDIVIHYKVRFKGGSERYRTDELERIDESYAYFSNKTAPNSLIKIAVENIISIDKVETTRLFKGKRHPRRKI